MASVFRKAVEKRLIELEKDRPYLAKLIGMNYQTLSGKFQRDSFDEDSIFLIAKKLNIDLNNIRDEIALTTGFIAIWKEENSKKKIIAFRIDVDYYKTRGIDTTEEDKAFDIALKQAVEEIFTGIISKKDILSQKQMERLKTQVYQIVDIGEIKYYISFSSDKQGGMKLTIDESLIQPHQNFLKLKSD